MADFDLDLQAIERDIDADGDRRVVLGILDGETPADDWVDEILKGNILVLSVEGDLSSLVNEFASDIKAKGGSLVHFRRFLIVTPAEIGVDTDKLN